MVGVAWRPKPRHMARPRSMPIAPAEDNKARANDASVVTTAAVTMAWAVTVAADGSVVDGCIRVGAAQSTLRVTAQLPPRAKAQSTEWRRRQRHWRRQLTVASSMAASEPAAQSTPRMTAQLPPRAKAQSTEWRRRQRHWRRQLTVASSMMPGPTAPRPRRKLMTQPRLREAAQGLGVQAMLRVTAIKLTVSHKPAAHEPKSTRPTVQPTPREPGAKVQDRRRQRLHHWQRRQGRRCHLRGW